MKTVLGVLSMITAFVGAGAVVIWSFVVLVTTIVAFANGVNEISLFAAFVFFFLRDILAGIIAVVFYVIAMALFE